MPRIVLLDYGMGNLGSVFKALEKAGAAVQVAASADEIASCDGIMLPGVGNFGDGIRNLRERGLDSAIHTQIASGKPFMGICLGMQMLMESSEEAPGVPGLGIFKGTVRRFPEKAGFKVPHVGWNQIAHKGTSPFLRNVPSGSHVYFVHSYYVEPADPSVIAARTDYIYDFAAALEKDNLFATQFHPEKSQREGIAILTNFVSACAATQENRK